MTILISLSSASSEVLAQVNDEKITKKDLQERLETLPEQQAAAYSSPEGKAALVSMLVNEKLVYKEAKKQGLDRDADFKKELERQPEAQNKEAMLIQYFLRKKLADADIAVSQQEVEAAYKENKDKFQVGERIEASHILVEKSDEAKEIIDQLSSGAQFAKLAKEKSKCPSKEQGGKLQAFSRGQMVPAFEEAAFSMEVGETTAEPIKTQFGWHVIRVTDRQEGGQQKLEEVDGQIRQILLGQKQQQAIEQIIEQARENNEVTLNI